MHPLYLGLDSSTQGLTATLIDCAEGRVLATRSVQFDADLPAFGTRNGVLRDADPTVVHAPPALWAAALDVLLLRMRAEGLPIDRVAAIAGSGQQHGSVYLTSLFPQRLAKLDPTRPLQDQLDGCFARATSPIWMDSSTSAACREIEQALAPHGGAAARTGSAVFERFTGPQIRAFWQRDPAGYQRTAQIALVSSFMASLLSGRVAPIDHGDGAGMNLMDIERRVWDAPALDATAPDLRIRLPALCASWTDIGGISAFASTRYGFSPTARCIAWSGDNPNSVIGLGLIEPGAVAISLGTSDTYFGTMRTCRTDPAGEGHVFVSPTGDYMSLICFKNGSLARERIRDQFALDWAGFSAALSRTSPGNGGRLMLPYFEPEIVPRVLDPGVRRSELREDDADANCRAVVEAQMMSMRIHSAWMGIPAREILATGGASRNPSILQVMADVFQCPVLTGEVPNSASLGAALRAAHAHTGKGWSDVVRPFCAFRRAATPAAGTAAVYGELTKAYARFEASVTRR